MAAIPDPAEAKQTTSPVKIQGWDVEKWIAYIERNPNATLPSGVGSMIIRWFTEPIPNMSNWKPRT